MDILPYLKRIGIEKPVSINPVGLSKLQQAHLLHIPFENLDIHLGVKINLSGSWNKIVNRGRGGFCYELNSVFYLLLRELGFSARLISARVFDPDKGFGPEFDHMAILVSFNNSQYLSDVGFGEFAFHPLRMETGVDLEDPRGVFRLEAAERDSYIVLKKSAHGDFLPEYSFTTKQREPGEFLEMCEFHQTSPDSHFTRKKICSMATAAGRITLTGNLLKITEGDRVTESIVANEDEEHVILKEKFGIFI